MRNKIFISHATPEDNDFTIWLASRLELLGYEVWIDKNGLIGGEKFWETIDNVIRNEAIKFLLVYSKNIFQKDNDGNPIAGKLKDGVYKEYSFAESIGKQNNINDFIVMMNIDASNYNLFIGADRLNQIPFYENWANGFKQLEKKLQKDNVPEKSQEIQTDFGSWYEQQFVCNNGITSKYELYYTNWWDIKQLPEYFYLYQFQSPKQATIIVKQFLDYPISKITNYLSSFEERKEFTIDQDNNTFTIKPQNVFKIKITDVLIGFESNKFPAHRDSENHFKKLLKEVFHKLMKNRGMFWYEMSNKRLAYFFTPANLSLLKTKFEYPYRNKNKSKTKNLIGKHKSIGNWHFAVSVKPILSPMLAFSLKSHIAFTTDGFQVLKNDKNEVDTDKIHSERRAKGKRMFNEEWRDLFLAFLNALKKDDKIEISLSSNFVLKMPVVPQNYWADFGYFDPKDKTRHGLLSMYEFEEENTEADD
ncbi:MAG: toll/interleukin-1 receptor domain-containing protein [Bacteroidetes bacterium]|nr:toll/interleukin-1 receptor domain-containing protein [Bacteroidota bacterium]